MAYRLQASLISFGTRSGLPSLAGSFQAGVSMHAALLLAIALFSSSARAQDMAPMPCVDSASTRERNQCFAAEVQSLDALLRAAVTRVERELRKRDQQDPMLQLARTFKRAQAKWTEYREAQCTFRSAAFGAGTGAPAEGMWCEVELGRARLDYLKALR